MVLVYDISSCPGCGGDTRLDGRRAEIFCRKCGLVVHDFLMSTDARFSMAEKILYSPKSRRVYLVVRSADEKLISELYREAEIVNATLGAPAWFVGDVMRAYMQLHRRGLTAGREMFAVLGGLFCLLSRANGLPYSDEDMAFACFASARSVLSNAKFASRNLGIGLQQLQAGDFVCMRGYELGLDERVITVAGAVCDELGSGRSYKVTLGLAYMVAAELCNSNVSARRIAKVCGTSVKTLKKTVVDTSRFRRYAELYGLKQTPCSARRSNAGR